VFQNKQIIIAFTCVALATTAFAQNTVDNSLYSRFGLGDLIGNETQQSSAQGGTSTTWSAHNSMNSGNPAALGALTLTEYSLGIYGKYGNLRTATESAETFGGNINHLSLAVPIFNPINEIGVKKKRDWKWGVGVGLRPYSQVAYEVETTREEPVVGSVTRFARGQGGIYQLDINNGFKWKNLSAGIGVQYYFGKALYTRRTTFNDSITVFNSDRFALRNKFVDNISYSGATIKLGAQYEYIITKQGTETDDDFRRKDKMRAIAGATFTPSANLLAKNTFATGRVLGFNQAREEVLDTLASSLKEGTDGTVLMPSSYSFGLRLIQDNHWQVAVQYDSKNWGAYENTARPEKLYNTYAIRVGGEWTPNYKSFTSYGSRMSYRAGFYKATDPRSVLGTQLDINAVTMGIGLPIRMPRGMLSHCNMNLEIGEQGNAKALSEFYTKFTLGFTLNDQLWFARPKYN
jgi:hypothetical protein